MKKLDKGWHQNADQGNKQQIIIIILLRASF